MLTWQRTIILLLVLLQTFLGDVPESLVVKVGDTIYVSGQIDVSVGANTSAQVWAVLRKVDMALSSVGVTKHQIVKSEGILTNIRDLRTLNTLYNRWMSGVEVLPAMTVYQDGGLAFGAKVEIAVVASLLPKTGTNGTRGNTPPGEFQDFPLPFTAAVKSGDFVYLSGMQGKGNTTAAQVQDTLRNIDAALASVGLDKQHIVQVEGILADIDDLGTLNVIYNRWQSGIDVLPAMMVWQPANLCGYAKVEITVIASTHHKSGTNRTKTMVAKASPPYPLPFTSLVEAGDRVYLSGTLSLQSENTTKAQVAGTLAVLEETLALSGLTKDDIVQSRAVLANIQDLGAFSSTYGDWLSGVQRLPATMVHQPANLCSYGKVEIELLATRSNKTLLIYQ